MSPMTSALISYWHRLPAESPIARRKTLDSIRERVRAGLEPRSALVPFALGDVDDGIVEAATLAYATSGDGSNDGDASCEATEWVRRGLALNRGAVFAALLAAGDAVVRERLASQRLTLSAEEVAVVCRQLPEAPTPSIVGFLQEWVDLVEGSDDPTLSRQHALVASALDRCTPAAIRRAAA
jgi:hypothetical protein